MQIESPILTLSSHINSNYTEEDIFTTQEDLVLRPETTMGSYQYAALLMESKTPPPIVVWQYGKSFRKEQDSPLSRMKLKDFYQLEYQFLYTADSKAPYYEECVKIVESAFYKLSKGKTIRCLSDRLPDYSEITIDINIHDEAGELEPCSISHRKDYPNKFNGKEIKVVEMAIGLDRCVARL